MKRRTFLKSSFLLTATSVQHTVTGRPDLSDGQEQMQEKKLL